MVGWFRRLRVGAAAAWRGRGIAVDEADVADAAAAEARAALAARSKRRAAGVGAGEEPPARRARPDRRGGVPAFA